MLPDRYYVADVHEGPKLRRLYFYANVEGLTDPEYGYIEDNSWIDQAYRAAIREFQAGRPDNPWGWLPEPGVAVTAAEPREIGPEELVRQDPWLNVYVVNAIDVAKREVEPALHPIRVTWYWRADLRPGDEVAVNLKLSDDTGAFGEGFGLRQLRDESLMKERIRRLYQNLLEFRSRTLILSLLRGKVGAGKD